MLKRCAINLPKKEFSSFDLAAAVRELKPIIEGSRVSNTYQTDQKTLLFKLHKPDRPPILLVMEAGVRLHLTAYELEKPPAPPAFCMALRKYLRNSRVTGVEQYQFERVATFLFRNEGGSFKLILELFGEGNIILIDGIGEILQALSYKRMRDRNILRGEAFTFAPTTSENPLTVSREEFDLMLKNCRDSDVVRAVSRSLGLGGLYSEEVLLRASIEKTRSCSSLADSDFERAFDCLCALLRQVSTGDLEPCIVLDREDKSFVDVVPIRMKHYGNCKCKVFDTFNLALDEFYVIKKTVESARTSVDVGPLEREKERLRRMISDQENVLVDAEAKAKWDRQVGDLIRGRQADLQVLLDRFLSEKQSGKTWSTIVSEVLIEKKKGVTPYTLFESFDAKNSVITVCVNGVSFSLYLRKGVFENAAWYYERGKRFKQKFEGVGTAIADSRDKFAQIEQKIVEAQEMRESKPVEAVAGLAERKIKRKEWFEKFRWFTSSDGFLVVAGKDAVSNEVLIKKHTERHDVVFHADIVGAPFVVVKTEGKAVSEQCLHEAVEFAAAFSRGWREGFVSVDAYWVKPDQLSKGGPSGESVAHGAFTVRGERSWFRGTPLRTSIGVMAKSGGIRFVGGPVDSVKAKTSVFVTVVPGDLSGKELFGLILRLLAEKLQSDLRGAVTKASVEEIREYVPYGQGTILRD
jgi:predicted ribosome quality control (RQC) complex YloA/Tae2 family protein